MRITIPSHLWHAYQSALTELKAANAEGPASTTPYVQRTTRQLEASRQYAFAMARAMGEAVADA